MTPTRQPRALLVVDLGFGDAGKGTMVDFFAREFPAVTHVVRANGGAQAGHNVVTPEGVHHCFAQFGAASFVREVRTHHGPHMILHPTALLHEAELLAGKGAGDVLARLTVDARALVTTPYEQALVRLRELARAHRGEPVHGTCGVGVGETVRTSIEAPGLAIRAAHLWRPAALRRRLGLVRERALGIAKSLELDAAEPRVAAELAMLKDTELAERWIELLAPLLRRELLVDGDYLDGVLNSGGDVIFEAAQGVLLDEWRGFHPHTTWSTCTTQRALELVAGHDLEVTRYGVVRTYQTRHGAGPMPSEDPSYREWTPEPHNDEANWQGAFRRGPLDMVLLRYALACSEVDALAVTHCDRLVEGRAEVVERYDDAGTELTTLPLGEHEDLEHQSALTERLLRVETQRRMVPDLVEHLAAETQLRVAVTGHGPRATDKRWTDY